MRVFRHAAATGGSPIRASGYVSSTRTGAISSPIRARQCAASVTQWPDSLKSTVPAQ